MAGMALNALLFQLGWWLRVLGGNRMALLVLAVALPLHWRYLARERAEWLCIALSAGLGVALDGALQHVGILQFGAAASDGVPFWLVALWLLFATTLNHSLRWLQTRLCWAVVLAALAAPFSYWGGVRFGAARFAWPVPQALLLVALCWGLLLPLLSAMMKHRARVSSPCKDC